MKNRILLSLLMVTVLAAHSQISISSSDMVSAGSIVRLSTAELVPGLDFETTGANTTWDFTGLVPVSQRVDTFLNISSTSLTYFGYFNLPSHKSNIAVHGPDIPATPSTPISLSNTYGFFNKTTSRFEQTGFGADINGISTPVGFKKNDIWYRFPMNFTDRDTSDSDFEITLPGLGYYGHTQTRYNYVDGWGTLSTPFGTFPTIRVMSEVVGSDTVFSESFGYGFRLPESTSREYKWLGTGSKLPLLQINTDVNLSVETVSGIYYQDSVRSIPNGIENLAYGNFDFSVYPNPSTGIFHIALPSQISNARMSISDMSGRLVSEKNLNTPSERVELQGLEPGIYFVRIENGKLFSLRKLVIQTMR